MNAAGDATADDSSSEAAARRSPRIPLLEFFARDTQPLPDYLRPDAREAIASQFNDGPAYVAYLIRFLALMAFSTGIAAMGLLADSTAVVIGAMLVAPLMVPILAAAAALVLADPFRLMRALFTIGLGLGVAVAVGWVVATITEPGATVEVPAEISSRTFPGLLDLGIALLAGGAGGYVLVRPDLSSALPGVGIAVALVPPLAVVGVELQRAAGDAGGAFLLFFTNLAAIILAAAIVFLASGLLPLDRSRRGWMRLSGGLAVVLLLAGVVVVQLTAHTLAIIEDSRFRTTVDQAVQAWDPTVRVVDLIADRDGDAATVDLTVAGPNEPLPAWALAREIDLLFGGSLELAVSHRLEQSQQASTR